MFFYYLYFKIIKIRSQAIFYVLVYPLNSLFFGILLFQSFCAKSIIREELVDVDRQ
jgi:hypothetical protein